MKHEIYECDRCGSHTENPVLEGWQSLLVEPSGGCSPDHSMIHLCPQCRTIFLSDHGGFPYLWGFVRLLLQRDGHPGRRDDWSRAETAGTGAREGQDVLVFIKGIKEAIQHEIARRREEG